MPTHFTGHDVTALLAELFQKNHTATRSQQLYCTVFESIANALYSSHKFADLVLQMF